MITLTNQEQEVLQRIGGSSDGRVIRGFCQKLVDTLVDIRNIPDGNTDVEKKARTLAVRIIQEEIINRFKILNGELQAPDGEEFT